MKPRAHFVEAAIKEISARFSGWQPTPAMLGYARAVAHLALEKSRQAEKEIGD